MTKEENKRKRLLLKEVNNMTTLKPLLKHSIRSVSNHALMQQQILSSRSSNTSFFSFIFMRIFLRVELNLNFLVIWKSKDDHMSNEHLEKKNECGRWPNVFASMQFPIVHTHAKGNDEQMFAIIHIH
jgi:hypothetical protein